MRVFWNMFKHNFVIVHDQIVSPSHASNKTNSSTLQRINSTTNFIYTLPTYEYEQTFVAYHKLIFAHTQKKNASKKNIHIRKYTAFLPHIQNNRSGNIVIFIHNRITILCMRSFFSLSLSLFWSFSMHTGTLLTIKLNDAEIFNFDDNLWRWPFLFRSIKFFVGNANIC